MYFSYQYLNACLQYLSYLTLLVGNYITPTFVIVHLNSTLYKCISLNIHVTNANQYVKYGIFHVIVR